MEQREALDLAHQWVDAWNSHDLEAIMSHYDEDVTLTSPVAARLLGHPDGTVRGNAALREYFARGLAVYQDLRFDLLDVMWGLASVVLYYRNQAGTMSGEFMEIGTSGKVTRVIANYSA